MHLGPGQDHYLPEWINVDANIFTTRCDLWADLTHPLPFRDNSVAAFYSHHVIEHLPDLSGHFTQVFRCLAPGGIYRVGGPHGDNAIRKFLQDDVSWFGDFPDSYRSIGGRLENFILCRNEHLHLLTISYLHELMSGAGFRDFAVRAPTAETGEPALFDESLLRHEHESTPECPHTLIVEARKPGVAARLPA